MLFEKVVESVNYCSCYFRLMFDHYAREGIKQRVVNEVRMPPWFFALPISIECFMKENQGKSTEARIEKRLCTMQPRFKTLENCTWKPLTPEGPMADCESSLGLQTSGSPSIKSFRWASTKRSWRPPCRFLDACLAGQQHVESWK